MSVSRTVVVPAPAKINLGLEILGKRVDGYHEIRTILATIDLADTIRIAVVPNRLETRINGVPDVQPQDNLIKKAIDAFSGVTGLQYGYDVNVEKHIPSPGGLGGASSDAASTLMALNATHGAPLSKDRLHALAATLGSDVPFFIGPSVALATGTGTHLEPLPAIQGWVVLIVPHMTMVAKTPTLYSALQTEDFTSGDRVARAAQALRNHLFPTFNLLDNAFTRPLYEIEPELGELVRRLVTAGAPHVILSGAGPAHFVLTETHEDAKALVEDLRPAIPEDALLTISSIRSSPTSVELQGL